VSTMHDITGLDHEPEARAVLERGLQLVPSGGVFVLLLSPEPVRTCAETSFPINSRGGDA